MFSNIFFFFFFYNALHYLQNIVYNICITLLTIHTYTYNNLVFCFFLHVYITLNYLQNTYSRFEKKKLLLTIHTFIHAHTRTRHTHTHARTQTLQHHTRLTLVLVCSNLLRTTDMQNAVIRYASYRSMFFRNLPHFAV